MIRFFVISYNSYPFSPLGMAPSHSDSTVCSSWGLKSDWHSNYYISWKYSSAVDRSVTLYLYIYVIQYLHWVKCSAVWTSRLKHLDVAWYCYWPLYCKCANCYRLVGFDTSGCQTVLSACCKFVSPAARHVNQWKVNVTFDTFWRQGFTAHWGLVERWNFV